MEMDCVMLGDCLEVMRQIPDASIDAIITDPPYGITEATWDVAIDLQAWWSQIRRIRKPTAPTVVFCAGKYCGELWASNPKEWKYDWIWKKKARMSVFLRKQETIAGARKNIRVLRPDAEIQPAKDVFAWC